MNISSPIVVVIGLLALMTQPSRGQEKTAAAEHVAQTIKRLGGSARMQNGNVVEVQLIKADVSDDDLQFLAGLEKLVWLRLENLPVDGSGLASLAQCTELAELDLSESTITGDALSFSRHSSHCRHCASIIRTSITLVWFTSGNCQSSST